MLIILNVFVFGSCLIMTDFETVVYSIIFSGITSVALDKVHLQNVTLDCVIITKSRIWKTRYRYNWPRCHLLERLWRIYRRGDKYYPDNCIQKEAIVLRREILKADPSAFVVFNEDVTITGNYQTRI